MFYNEFEVITMIPKQYRHETDYRKIPREYLDSNIPQGRGIVKWARLRQCQSNINSCVTISKNKIKLTCPSYLKTN